MDTLHYYECPSWVCKTCRYVFKEKGVCPECNQQLIKCSYKTDECRKDELCPFCKNGVVLQIRNKVIYKTFIEPIFEDNSTGGVNNEEDIRIKNLRKLTEKKVV